MTLRMTVVACAALAWGAGCSDGGGGDGDPGPPPPVNSSPVGVDDSAATTMNVPVTIDVLADDTDPDLDALFVAHVTQGLYGTTTVTVNDAVTYTPNSGYTGYDSFSYTVSDGRGGSAQAIVTVLISYTPGLPIERISVASDGTQGNHDSWMGSLSAGGRFVGFYTSATNLATQHTSGQLLLHDRETHSTTVVTLASGAPANLSSQLPALSDSGRFMAFESFASDLVPGDTNDCLDIFVHDRQSGTTSRVSVAASGAQADGYSRGPAITPDGRFIAFFSVATNLDAADLNGAGNGDIFLHDRQTGTTTLVSVDSNEVQTGADYAWPVLSGNGKRIAFVKLGQVHVRDRDQGTTVLVSRDSTGTSGNGPSGLPVISENGRFVAFVSTATNLVAGDTNGAADVFVHDLQTGSTTRASVASNGSQGDGAVPAQNRPAMSADGRFVAFISEAANLVAGDTNATADAFVHDRTTGQTARVSVSATGIQGNDSTGDYVWVSITASGHFVAFSSESTNLVSGDTNGWMDVFVAPNPLVP